MDNAGEDPDGVLFCWADLAGRASRFAEGDLSYYKSIP